MQGLVGKGPSMHPLNQIHENHVFVETEVAPMSCRPASAATCELYPFLENGPLLKGEKSAGNTDAIKFP